MAWLQIDATCPIPCLLGQAECSYFYVEYCQVKHQTVDSALDGFGGVGALVLNLGLADIQVLGLVSVLTMPATRAMWSVQLKDMARAIDWLRVTVWSLWFVYTVFVILDSQYNGDFALTTDHLGVAGVATGHYQIPMLLVRIPDHLYGRRLLQFSFRGLRCSLLSFAFGAGVLCLCLEEFCREDKAVLRFTA